MKKIALLVVFGLLLRISSFAQPVFQATFTNVANQLIFSIKPTSTIDGGGPGIVIGYMQFAFRYPTASTPAFTISNITPNTTAFPGLTITQIANYTDPTYTYLNFVFTGGTIAQQTYTGGTTYQVFTLNVNGTGTANFDLASDSTLGQLSGGTSYQFLVADQGFNIISAPAWDGTTGAELYGPGVFKSGTGIFLPLANVVLPIEFLNFTATLQNDDAKLNWTVANENSSSKDYQVEKSIDNGASFITIDTIKITNPTTLGTYTYTDTNVSSVKAASNKIYYRIKQVDKDGQFAYSATEIIHPESANTDLSLSVYPNPVKDNATIKFNLDEDATVTVNLSDVSGHVLQSWQYAGVKGTNTEPINLSSIVSGKYVLSLNDGTSIHIVSVIKAN